MPVHAICPSLKCQKILELPEDARGHEVTCRYCGMHFRVPRVRRRPVETNAQPLDMRAGPSASRIAEPIYVGG